MLLIYCHIYLSSTLLGYFIDPGLTNVLKDIRNIELLVSDVQPLPKKQTEKVRRLQTVEEIEVMFPGFKAFLDATEQGSQDQRTSINERRTTAEKKRGMQSRPS